MSAMADSAERIVIEGRVQGVGFRAWAMDEADAGACAAGCATAATAGSRRY